MIPVLMAAAATGVFLVAAVSGAVWLGGRAADADLERRLRRAAAALRGDLPAAGDAAAGVFRSRPDKSWLYERIERRFSMLDGRRALPRAAALGFLAAVAAVAAAVLLQLGTLLTLLTPAAWIAGGWVVLRIADAASRAEFVKRFPEVVDQTVRLTRAGLPAVEALSIVAQEAQEPVRRLLRQISHELSSGLDPELVLRGAAARVRIPEFTLFAAALCLQRTTGGTISAALANLSATLRARKELEMKAHASTAQTRMTLWVLSAVPVVVVAAQSYTNPGAVEMLFETPTLLRWGVGLIVAGLLMARFIASRFGR